MQPEFKPRILGFLCNWCSYAGADLAGVSRYQYPPTIKVIRVMCSGRMDLEFVLRALANGNDGVFVGGCWLGECHYITEGNHDALSMMHIGRKLLERIGVEPERLRLEWVSASQGLRFAEVVSDFTRQLKDLGPVKVSRVKIEAIKKLLPYVRLVEREKLRVRFESKEEYEKFFASEAVNRLFDELLADRLAVSQIMVLLGRQALSSGEIADALGMAPSDVAEHLKSSARQRLVKFDPEQKRYALA